MFGYIAINKAEMKFKDYDVYHSYYCGLCQRLKECYGRRGQMTLSFDMTFLILFLTGLYEPETKVKTVNCIAHPLEKHTARINEFTDSAAAANLLLTYYNLMDDWTAERKRKSVAAARLLRPPIRTIQKIYPAKSAKIHSSLSSLTALERSGEQSLDKMAGLFGQIMAELFTYREDEWADSLRKIGFFLGKFIYLMDAYEDVEQDLKTGSYNPLKEDFQQNPNFAQDCRQLLTLMMAECSREFETLPILLHAEILRNILYSGVWCRYTSVTARRQKVGDSKTSLPNTHTGDNNHD